jgi:nitronate monooxygenase
VSREEYAALLNLLLECERAGEKLLASYCDELPPGCERRAWLTVVQRDEARNCATLVRLLRAAGATPSTAVGRLYRHGMAIRDWDERLAFFNRGQRRVADRIAAVLPEIERFAEGRRLLAGMLGTHLLDIRVCEEMA